MLPVGRPTTPASVDGLCPDNWEEWGSHCFYFASNNYPKYAEATWDSAHENCQGLAGSNYPSTGLASIHNKVTNEWIYKTLMENGLTVGVWIGLSKTDMGLYTIRHSQF